MPNVGPTSAQMMDQPHQNVCKSRTPHLYLELVPIKWNVGLGLEENVAHVLESEVESTCVKERAFLCDENGLQAHAVLGSGQKKRKASIHFIPVDASGQPIPDALFDASNQTGKKNKKTQSSSSKKRGRPRKTVQENPIHGGEDVGCSSGKKRDIENVLQMPRSNFGGFYLDTRKIILEGTCTIIANGNDTNIWWQPWIPWLGYEEFRKTMEEIRVKAPTLRTVSDLFLQSQGVWNQRTPSGCFSAKEAYWADLEHRFGEAQKVWKLIWSSRIHLRAGLFLWRMCSDVLPTRDKLGRVDENWCLLCNCAAESSLHIFFECSLTRSVWFGAPIPLRIEGLQGGNVLARIQDMCCNLSEEEASRLLVYGYVIWDTIWKFRNSRLFGGKCRDSLSLLVEVRKRFEEFYGITSLVATKVPQQAIQFLHRAPFNSKILVTDGSFKDGCCCLAAVGIERNTSAWNYVCRSSEGISALDVELKAIAMALQWVAGQGWNSVTLFSDCLVAVNALNNSRLPDWKLAAGFSNILKLVKSFDQCFFCFAKRDCITGVNDLAFRARTGNVMDLCCLGEGLPPVNPMLFG
ncbi:hypothetical protein F8388_002355 [Cannabis sativa]|uniref:RNase H type-1 domain-containing protein n=1 Tax=Cannabis sativa TaxID=3483 RepID=A0A7J6EX36_CANSA|nr:hypothetical protein F8388_002355 [Cannabis sativa]